VNSFGYPPFATARYQHVWSYSIVNLWTALLMLNLREGGLLTKALSRPFLVFTGRMSYGLYVLHYPLLGLLKHAIYLPPFSARALLVFPLFIAVLYAVAYLSYTRFESRFLALKDARFAESPSVAVG
jgi:peptidoglycan/LPS O-acetylase OafA/YrhL